MLNIKPFICPNCGKEIDDYYGSSEGPMFYDDATIFIDYHYTCSCGQKSIYTEWYELHDTEIEKA